MDKSFSSTRPDPATEAAKFFIEFRAGDATSALRAQFDHWWRSSPDHVQAYLEIARRWSQLPIGDPEDQLDLQALLKRAREVNDNNVIQLRARDARVARRSRPSPQKLWTLAASLAALVILIGSGTWVATQRGHTYSTGIGEQRTLILADGSTVTLNARTTIRIHLTTQSRDVTLVNGQAYFHDREEPNRPFIVRVGEEAVRAIGTEFDVQREPDRTVVTVLEGQVAVARASAWIENLEHQELLQQLAHPTGQSKAILLSAGKQVTISSKDIPAPSSVDVTAVTAWMQQRVVFDNTPLNQVARQFNLYSKRRLVIADPSLWSVGVSGDYPASDPAALVGFLRSEHTLKIIETDDKIVVTSK